MSFSAYRPPRFVLLLLTVALAARWSSFFLLRHPNGATAATVAVGQRQPVLVELFTSEGCSSCPPADALLARLDSQQFVEGAQAIVLSEHVTYWNHLGWRDPFSLDAATDRQKEFAVRFGPDSVYTPEAVVDGSVQEVGSDEAALRKVIAHAAALPKFDLAIQDAKWSGGTVHFNLRAGGGSAAEISHSTVTAVLAEDSAESAVGAGENKGRTLHHVAVVRVLEEIGKGALDGRMLTLKLPSANQPGQSRSLRLVVFVTDRHSGRVVAAAEQTLTQ
jgi:hypothetical protein